MRISHNTPRLSGSPRLTPVPPRDPNTSNLPEDQCDPGMLRKAVGALAAAGSGSVGFAYGAFNGLVKGVRNIPAASQRGLRLGTSVVEPFTRCLGAVSAVVLTAGAGAGIAALAVLSTVRSLATGTAQGTLDKGWPLVKGAARTAASAGAQVGSAVLGAVGGALGALVGLCSLPSILYPPFGLRVIPAAVRLCASAGLAGGRAAGHLLGGAAGGILGAAAGTVAGVARGLSHGLRSGQEGARQQGDLLRQVPEVAQTLWKHGQFEGHVMALVTGGAAFGMPIGLALGLVATVGHALAGGVQGASSWGEAGYRTLTSRG